MADDSFRVSEINIHTKPIFTNEERESRRIFQLIDRLHVTTRDETIKRMLWKDVGDRITDEELAEIERNIRNLGIFSDVEVTSIPNPENIHEIGINIVSRDRISLFPLVLPFSVGGIDGFSGLVVEDNLFGTADRISLRTERNSENERETRFSYTNRQLGRSLVSFEIGAATTDEGNAYNVNFGKSPQHLQDPWFWRFSLDHTEERIDYFDFGESVAEVPSRTSSADASIARAYGDPDGRSFLGLSLSYKENDFGIPLGSQANTISVPGDRTDTTVGLFHQFRRNTRFIVEQNMDRIGVDEDLTLGFQLNTVLAVTSRDDAKMGRRVEPSVLLDMRWADQIGTQTYLTAQIVGSARFNDGTTRARSKKGELHLFRKTGHRSRLALNLNYEDREELDDLPPQLTLGEDNGLRGYPARQFTGRKRARLNVEHRTNLNREFLTFKTGVVAFADAGWIGDEDLRNARTSVGIGLRLASPQFTGGRVLRLDFAHPLNTRADEDFGMTISLAIGQTFDFFGSNSTLSNR